MLLTISDVEARTGQTYTDAVDIARVNALIEDVTALVESYCRKTFTVVPTAVKAVAAREVIAALNVDYGIASERVGDLSTSYTGSGSVTTLSTASRYALKPYRRRSLGSLRVFSSNHVSLLVAPVLEPAASAGTANVVVSGRSCYDGGVVLLQSHTGDLNWVTQGTAAARNLSDGLDPFWTITIPALTPATYRWRARVRFDQDESDWAVATVNTVVGP